MPGRLGSLMTWIAVVASLAAAILYFLLTRPRMSGNNLLKSGARFFYFLGAASVTASAFVLFYIIGRHFFEYAYVWRYSSSSLPVQYIISCFWAGQEGSFLIWALFQALIGGVLIFRSKDWEPWIMWVFALSNTFLVSMLLGIDIGGFRIGSSPFVLLRDVYGSAAGSLFRSQDYLTMVGDGNGLNPLLENFWMTIHPPVLFLGYAFSLVPFSYASGALLRGQCKEWLKPALPWLLCALFFLGAGILLGGAWAYVSLTFGGFWAWDPVENSSLVPWMTLLASLHFMLVARKQNNALFMAFLFSMFSFLLVLYASYLTRSGMLANTSAHSFGDSGMAAQLLIYLLLFFLLMLILLGVRFRNIGEHHEEVLLSREFWMFVGSVVVVLASFQILFTTSIPVVNALFGMHLAPPSDAAGFYNRWQLPFTLIIAAFIGFSQFLDYQANDGKTFLKRSLMPLLIAVLMTIAAAIGGIVRQVNYILFLFFLLFAMLSVLSNALFRAGGSRNWPALITHFGFALFMSGVLITFSNSTTISRNTSGFDLGSTKANRENLLLPKGDTLYMGGYYATYVNETKTGNLTRYRIDFLKKSRRVPELKFSLYPSVNAHPRMGMVYNPDTKHFITRDFYTYISSTGKDPDFVVIRTVMNPWINILWTGAVMMMAGLGWSVVRRIRRF